PAPLREGERAAHHRRRPAQICAGEQRGLGRGRIGAELHLAGRAVGQRGARLGVRRGGQRARGGEQGPCPPDRAAHDYLRAEPTGTRPVAAPRLGRRTTRTFPVPPPPQKNRSPPSDSSPDTLTPGGISSVCRTSPVRGSTRRRSLTSSSQVPCQSSPSTQVTPVTKRLDSIVRRIAPVSGSIWWILRSRCCPTHSVPSAHVSPEPAPPGTGIVASTRPDSGSIFWMRSSASW